MMKTKMYFPLPIESDIRMELVGRNLQEVSVPNAILDIAKLRTHCRSMLEAVRELDVEFRAHIKTHKTLQLSKMQVGEDSKDVRLICSTLAEMEFLQPLLADFQSKGAQVNVLYGIPAAPGHVQRLAAFLSSTGPSSLTMMIDNEAQLKSVVDIYGKAGNSPPHVFIKCDSGYHRAGLLASSKRMHSLVQAVLSLETAGKLKLTGFYTHNSLSYGGNNPQEAMDNLREEVEASVQAAELNLPVDYIKSRSRALIVSSGASPTALSLQNLLSKDASIAESDSANALRQLLALARSRNINFEIHAGVYPTLDMQQVSAASRDLGSHPEDSIAITVLAEVASTYPDRTNVPEALINAGSIALAREPCKSYRGFGVISSWGMGGDYNPYSVEKRIIVDRVSQEHGILQWENKDTQTELPVEYGQRLRIFPNHSCIAGSHFPYYLIVDSSIPGKVDVVQDVWVRCRGW